MWAFANTKDRKNGLSSPGKEVLKKLCLKLLLPVLLLLQLTACGSGEEEAESLGIGIDAPTDTGVHALSSRQETLTVGGFVFESPHGKATETACNCVGFACFFDPQCITVHVPRVEVIVTNQTSGAASGATIAFSPDAASETPYRWSASVALVAGENRVVARADDG